MKNIGTALLVAVCLGSGAVVAAQSTPRGSGTTAQPGLLTVTGCLQRSNTGVPPAASNVDAGQTTGGAFMLANARPSAGTAVTSGGPDASGSIGRSAPAARSTSGTAAASPPTRGGQGTMGAARTYTLIEGKAGELMSHVGHQIEITGTLVSAAGRPDGATGTTGAAGSTSRSGGSDTAGMTNQRLAVTSVMMISPTCPSVQVPAASSTTPR